MGDQSSIELYTVSFGGMDQEVGSNPFWHTFLLLSRYDENTKKMEVVEHWGFYGVPSSSQYSFIRQIKRDLAMDTDFYGNHGMLQHEEVRTLDQGRGLHAVTFELTAEKFKMLQAKCRKMVTDQEEAINDAVRDLKLEPAKGKTRNYLYEHESRRIYQYELKRAEEEKREPRLHEFSLSLSADARTCKAQIVSILDDDILTPKQIERIKGKHPAITRFSGVMENIYLHSTGPLKQHKKSSGASVYYREGNEVKLYWTVPPQEFEALTNKSLSLLKIHNEYAYEVKKIVNKLQAIEWFFRNTKIDNSFSNTGNQLSKLHNKLLEKIIQLYEAFATIEPKSKVAKNNWTSFWQWLASQPRDIDEKILLDKLENAKNFMNRLYWAMVDDWKIEAEDANEQYCDNKESLDSSDDDVESLASYLTVDEQKKLCEMIGRNYYAPDNRLESSSEEKPFDFSANNINEEQTHFMRP